LALAALWGVHPLLTESVTNIVGRADLLAAFGVLAGLLCYVKSASATGRRKLFWVAAMVAAQMVGIFSKENAAVLPGIMLLYDLTWRRRAAWRGRALTYAALAPPLAAFFCLRVTMPMHILARFGDNPLMSAGFWTARLTAIKVIGKYLWLFVWPARLSADYSYNAVPRSAGTARASRCSSFWFSFSWLSRRHRTWWFSSAASWPSGSSICLPSGWPGAWLRPSVRWAR
jgi:hypothetical protein